MSRVVKGGNIEYVAGAPGRVESGERRVEGRGESRGCTLCDGMPGGNMKSLNMGDGQSGQWRVDSGE